MTTKGWFCRTAVFCALVACSRWSAEGTRHASRRNQDRPVASRCLTGPSCTHCTETVPFHSLQVCCFHCRLDNLLISQGVCRCLNTRLTPDLPVQIVGGNCSSGRLCDNCAMKLSSRAGKHPSTSSSSFTRSTAAVDETHFCCDDCGIVTPSFFKTRHSCVCVGDLQGRVHEAAPWYAPVERFTTTTATSPPFNKRGTGPGPRVAPHCWLPIVLFLVSLLHIRVYIHF